MSESNPQKKTSSMIQRCITGAVLVALLLGFVVYQFWATGQLDPRYWEFFTWRSTWAVSPP